MRDRRGELRRSRVRRSSHWRIDMVMGRGGTRPRSCETIAADERCYSSLFMNPSRCSRLVNRLNIDTYNVTVAIT